MKMRDGFRGVPSRFGRVGLRTGGGGAWSPAALFSPGDKGGYAAVSDGVFTDTGGTSPASSSGVVARSLPMKYPGGGTGPVALTSAINAPLYIETSGGAKVLRFDGVNDAVTGAGFDLSGCTKATFVVSFVQYVANTSAAAIFEHLGPPNSTGGLAAYLGNGAPSGNLGGGFGASGAFTFNNGFPASAPRSVVATLTYDSTGATKDDQLRIRVNGLDVDESQIGGSGTAISPSAFGSGPLSLGARGNGSSLYAQIDVAGFILIGRGLTEGEATAAEAWAAGLLAGDRAYADMPVSFSDSVAPVQETGWLRPSSFSQAEYTTTATSMDVVTYNNLFGSYPTLTKLGVFVDGEYQETLSPAAAGLHSFRVTLPAGSKTVALVNGPQSRPSGYIGAVVQRVAANAALSQVVRAASDMYIYGDSITTGSDATNAITDAWAMLTRAAAQNSGLTTAVDGYGYRALYDDAADATARTAFVAKIADLSPSRVVLAIGTNDYGLNKWSAAGFGTAYADVLDRIHAALPSAQIYCVTPLSRTTETANGSGSTCGDYRAQITSAVGARTAYAHVVDGPSIMDTTSLTDGIHPNTAGHALYANAVKAALGLV